MNDATIRWSLLDVAGHALAFGKVARTWRTDEAFRQFWIDSLRGVSFGAYCWECPPVDDLRRSRPFECAFVSSPSLARMPPDADDFAEHVLSDREVVTFPNLGGDAMLVAPCPDPAGGNFAHLASFTASASPRRQQALWEAVGAALEARIGAKPAWLSTAGHGVAWLHVRLDDRPKYYRYRPYVDA